MEVVADLHVHSKYSRAVSKQMVIPQISKWAKKKGIDLVGSADWTHPLWFQELKRDLVEVGDGVFAYKEDLVGPKFLLVTEISSIFSQGGRGRRIHTLFFAPSFEVVEKINEKLRSRGANLLSDGRPIIGLPVKDLAEIVWSVSPECLVVPSHLWTPWFGTYGDKGGFNSLEEAYGNLSSYIFAVETGHSSDPAMNWRVSELDKRAILSFSDAHSPAKMSREVTVFEVNDSQKIQYKDIVKAIKEQQIAYTIEFYPEEGKYHYTGHRKCAVKHSPEETKKLGETCPVCGRQLTIGVMHRVEELATRTSASVAGDELRLKSGVRARKWGNRPVYVKLVPLAEILAEALESGFSTQTVLNKYDLLIEKFGSELRVLLESEPEDIAGIVGDKIAEGIKKVRNGEIVIEPGYDGVFGTVKIWPNSTKTTESEEEKQEKEQMCLF